MSDHPRCDLCDGLSGGVHCWTHTYDDATDVRCSCGKVAVLRFDAAGFCRCDDPAWTYHADPDDDRKSRLWHCGAEGHYQAGLRKHVEPAT